MIDESLVVIGKLGLIAASVAALCIACSSAGKRLLADRRALGLLVLGYVLLRVASLVGIYGLGPGGVESSDLVLHYLPQSRNAAAGLLPYRDFPSSYGPLFPPLMAALSLGAPSPASLAVVMVGFEALALAALGYAIRAAGDRAFEWTFLLYVANPATAYFVGVTAHNSTILAFCWALGLLLRQLGRSRLGLLAVYLSAFVGKLLGLLVLPAFAIDRRLGVRGVVLVSLATAVAVAALYLAGFDLLMPARREAGRYTPGNLWFLSSAFLDWDLEASLWRFGPALSFLLAGGILVLGAAYRHRFDLRLCHVIALVSAINLLFMLLSKKSYPFYAPMFLPFACYVAACGGRRLLDVGALMIAGSLGLFTPSLWNALGQPATLSPDPIGDAASASTARTLLGLDALTCLAHAWLLWASLRLLFRPRGADSGAVGP